MRVSVLFLLVLSLCASLVFLLSRPHPLVKPSSGSRGAQLDEGINVKLTRNATCAALVTLAFGADAQHDVQHLFLSLGRHLKGLCGAVVVTDGPVDIEAGSLVKIVRASQLSLKDVPKVKRPDGSALSDRRRRKMRIKFLKTRLFDILDVAGVKAELAMFVDADIVIGTSLKRFVGRAQSALQRGGASMAAFPDAGHTGSPYHTGVLVQANKARNSRLITLWGDAIQSGLFKGDQEALESVVKEHELDQALVKLEVEPFFAFVDAPVLKSERPIAFLHCSKYRLENPVKFGFSLADVSFYMQDVLGLTWSSAVPPVDAGVDPSRFIVFADHVKANTPTTHNTALVSIAVGEKSRAFGRLLIRSFAMHGQFAGPLYIVTDDEEYFLVDSPDLSADDDDDDGRKGSRRQFLRRHGGLPRNVRFLHFGNGTCEDLQLADVKIHKKKSSKSSGKSKADLIANGLDNADAEKSVVLNSHNRERLQIKWLKTQFFRLLPVNIRFALFLDSDMIVERPLHFLLDDAFDAYMAPRTPAKLPPVITLYRDFGNTGMPYHTGVLFMSRRESQPLLDAWGDHILEGWTKSDQKCINKTMTELGLRDRVAFLDTELHNFAFINGSIVTSGQTFTLLHATFYRLSMADKFGFTREEFAVYLQQSAQLSARGAILTLVPDAAEVAQRQAERAKQKAAKTRHCKFVETGWQGYIVQWCP